MYRFWPVSGPSLLLVLCYARHEAHQDLQFQGQRPVAAQQYLWEGRAPVELGPGSLLGGAFPARRQHKRHSTPSADVSLHTVRAVLTLRGRSPNEFLISIKI